MKELRVDWCSYEAAKYAVLHWHYSKRMPKSKLVKIGVWEDINFIGTVIFGVGATRKLVQPYKLQPEQGCELVRIALREHVSSVTKIVSKAIKMLSISNPGLRLIVSFADPDESHFGIIYQAGNWIFTGVTVGCWFYRDTKGKLWHPRRVSPDPNNHQKYIKTYDCVKVWRNGKYRYLYPLDKAMRRQIVKLAQPYPKKDTCGQSVNGDTPAVQAGGLGSIPSDRSQSSYTS